MDLRDPGYLQNNPQAMEAFRFVCQLTPENFLRFVRMCIEWRETLDQKVITHASEHYRSSKHTED